MFRTETAAAVVLGVTFLLVGAAVVGLHQTPVRAPAAPPARLCPVEGEVMQWPCKHIPWEGRA